MFQVFSFLFISIYSASLLAAADCRFVGERPTVHSVQFEEVLSGLDRPVKMAITPSRPQEYFIAEQAGVIRSVGASNAITMFLDIRDRVTRLSSGGDERGLLGLAFHPDFANNKKFYVNYTTQGNLRTRISEFRIGNRGLGDPTSEKILLEFAQPFSNHNGGEILFGPDGYLYIGTGDGGSGGDPRGNGQSLKTFLGKVLRIDVNRGSPYAIPSDNPVWNAAGARPEIFAYGLRNPWRMSFDSVTGDLWAGDVGQNKREEVDIIRKGKNYGWNTMEGSICYLAANCNQEGLEKPIFEYGRDEGFSITGGVVYRGTQFPQLVGTYIFGDFGSGRVWGLEWDGERLLSSKVLVDSKLNIADFGTDHAGEIYLLAFDGKIYRMKPAESFAASIPVKLSETGCMKSNQPQDPIDAFISYEVNSPLWSDGLDKSRFVKLPANSRVVFDEKKPWTFPDGTVVMKSFFLPRTNRSDVIETRFIVKKGSHFEGYSYRWREDKSDADLLSGASVRSISYKDEEGQTIQAEHYFPSPSDCGRCHHASVGEILGLSTLQANVEIAGSNQLKRLADKGFFTIESAPQNPRSLSHLKNLDDEEATTDQKARSYLHAQCQFCHNGKNRNVPTQIDLTYSLPLKDTKTCGVAPSAGDLGNPNHKIIAAGKPEESLIYLRTTTLNPNHRMPPLASKKVDVQGTRTLANWILGIQNCP